MNNLKNNMDDLRIAWLLPTAWFYWQPTLSEFTKYFPQTKVFAGLWSGFARGFEDSLTVEVVGQRKVIPVLPDKTGYGSNFTYVSPAIVGHLFQFKPHVIFTNSFGVWTVLALLFKLLGGWRVVIAYEGSSPGVDYRNSLVRLLIRRGMVWAADACITNSHAGKTYLTEILYAERHRVFVHPYEVPATNSMLGEKKLAEPNLSQYKQPIFIFVGNIIPRKGLHLLLEACAMLQKQGCDSYTLLVVGDGVQRKELETLTQKRGLEERVQWIGKVDYDRLGTYFAKADVFVLPTLEDTWGMVVLEAMVLGKPILCSKWAGASELAIEGENGYSFDPYEPEKLANLMFRFIKNPDLTVVMGEKSKQLMAQYTPDNAAQFLTQVASFVLKQRTEHEVVA